MLEQTDTRRASSFDRPIQFDKVQAVLHSQRVTVPGGLPCRFVRPIMGHQDSLPRHHRGGAVVDLKAGETIYRPANVAHWHGAAPNSSAVLLSVYPVGVKLQNGTEVTEDDYLGRSDKRP